MRENKLKSDFLGFNMLGFFGVVEDRDDPLKLARVRVRAYRWHTDNLEYVPTEALPWAHVMQPGNSAMNSGVGLPATGLLEGTLVFGFFLDGDKAQRPMVLGSLPGIPQSGPDTELGFNDPDGRYPSIVGEPDISRLARNESITQTIISDKSARQRTGIGIANNVTTWSQPDFAYNARYPYNHVWQTESGHIIEMDDSAGSERIHIYHKSGTFVEIDVNGTKVEQVIGDNYEINERSKYLYINGFNNVFINGDCNIKVANNYNLDVDGNMNVKVGGDYDIEIAGNKNINAGESLQIKANEVIQKSTFDYDITVGGESNIKTAKNFMVTGAEVHLNSPFPKNANPKSVTLGTALSRITLPTPTSLPFLATINRDDLAASFFDDLQVNSDNLTTEVESQIQSEIVKNSSNRTVDNVPVGLTPFSTSVTTQSAIPADTSFTFTKRFPDTLQLSDNYNLGNLSSRAVVSKYRIREQHGLSTATIVTNLKSIAQNVLEPILAKYPDMIVTSGFRVGNSRSQHERGEAVDIQFRNRSKEEYFEIAKDIASLVPIDQLLLEYKNFGTGLPWIHISHKVSGTNRGQLYTFFNHKKKYSSLVDLS